LLAFCKRPIRVESGSFVAPAQNVRFGKAAIVGSGLLSANIGHQIIERQRTLACSGR